MIKHIIVQVLASHATDAAVPKTGVSHDLNEKFLALFPAWPTLLATLLSFIILLIFLTWLVWKPVKEMMASRKLYIQNNIDESVKNTEGSIIDRNNANEELIGARIQAAHIISDAKVQAEHIKSESTAEAKDHANQIMQDAKTDIQMQKAKLEIDTKTEIIEVALEAAKKIIEKDVDSAINRKLVADYIASK